MKAELLSIGSSEIDQNPEQCPNFNNEVLVKITPAGERVWDEYYNAIGMCPDLVPLKRDENGNTIMQLCDVAQIFGPHMYNGNSSPPVEMNFRFVE